MDKYDCFLCSDYLSSVNWQNQYLLQSQMLTSPDQQAAFELRCVSLGLLLLLLLGWQLLLRHILHSYGLRAGGRGGDSRRSERIDVNAHRAGSRAGDANGKAAARATDSDPTLPAGKTKNQRARGSGSSFPGFPFPEALRRHHGLRRSVSRTSVQ